MPALVPAPAPSSNPLPCDITVRQGTGSTQALTACCLPGCPDHRDHRVQGIPFNPQTRRWTSCCGGAAAPANHNMDKWHYCYSTELLCALLLWIYERCGWPSLLSLSESLINKPNEDHTWRNSGNVVGFPKSTFSLLLVKVPLLWLDKMTVCWRKIKYKRVSIWTKTTETFAR